MLCVTVIYSAQKKITVRVNPAGLMTSVLDASIHEDYGVAYPLTYVVTFPDGVMPSKCQTRTSGDSEWREVLEKDSTDFFNGIEAVRYDSTNSSAFVSVAFGHENDTLQVRFQDAAGNNIEPFYSGLSPYYDNRKAGVICSADDWASWFDSYFPYAVSVFRDYNLWISVGIISEGCDATTWQHIQEQLDLGMVEAASHSRNHPHVPYEDAEYEVRGSKQDIIEHLDLPDGFRKGEKEYVYVWIAPYGEYDDEIDTLVAENQYIMSRMYSSNDYGFPDWVDDLSFYGAAGMSREVGPFWQGSTDLADLNQSFDTAYDQGGIYHLMCHPHVLSQEGIWQQDYIWSHLAHVSNRHDVWYASVGQAFLYHMMQDASSFPTLSTDTQVQRPSSFVLNQNFPNPFNPTTTIRYELIAPTQLRLSVYDIRGQFIKTLTEKNQTAGNYEVQWDGTDDSGKRVSTGVYICRLDSKDQSETIKMVYLN
jgi:hypothetical protein